MNIFYFDFNNGANIFNVFSMLKRENKDINLKLCNSETIEVRFTNFTFSKWYFCILFFSFNVTLAVKSIFLDALKHFLKIMAPGGKILGTEGLENSDPKIICLLGP